MPSRNKQGSDKFEIIPEQSIHKILLFLSWNLSIYQSTEIPFVHVTAFVLRQLLASCELILTKIYGYKYDKYPPETSRF